MLSRIRDPGVCGGRVFPALHPPPPPHQPGGDKRQTGVLFAGEDNFLLKGREVWFWQITDTESQFILDSPPVPVSLCTVNSVVTEQEKKQPTCQNCLLCFIMFGQALAN